MRPVEKWSIGTHTLPDGSQVEVKATYDPYRDAKPVLVKNLGCSCSYCEKAFAEERDLDVEHIQPKRYCDSNGVYIYAHLATSWDNFLISCSTCNGADNKGNTNVVCGHCHLPHVNNTFLSLVYKPGGVVMANPQLTGISFTNAETLLKLVGLQKTPKNSSRCDKRWMVRTQAWNLAQKYLTKYRNGNTDVDTIVDLVKGHGSWSIWFTVFQGHDAVRAALLDFPGTAKSCFDPANGYEPLERNPGQEDPV